MKYCPNCKEYKDDHLNLCDECFGPLNEVAAPVTAPPPPPPPPPAAEAPETQVVDLAGSAASAWIPDSAAAPTAPAAPAPASGVRYAEVVADVAKHLEMGFDLYGFVGHSGSGKTHCLKALTHLLHPQGVGSEKARVKILRAPVPEASDYEVFDYAFTGANGERWVFVDAAGELYRRLQTNDWTSDLETSLRLTRYLDKCKGLFLFLHVNRGHLRRRDIDLDEKIHQGVEADRRKALDARQELDFFKNFLLFLRAVKAEGDLGAVVDKCRESGDMDETLREYHTRAPLLDIPVTFFFSKADSYAEERFEVGTGIHMAPRQLPMSAAVFTARYLPSLFAGVLSQVRRFKFDFLQSYEETRTTGLDGDRLTETHWHSHDDLPLSVGLLAGLEFILRNQSGERPWWRRPGIDTRQALWIHRLLHREEWREVKVDLGGFWRRPAELEA